MDAVAEDDKGRFHNLEIQLDAGGLSPERGRYHASVLDIEYLNPGANFTKLPETFVVFICDADLYLKGEPIYQVDRVVRTGMECIEDFGDRQHIIYVNADWYGDDDLGWLMHAFHCTKTDDMHFSLSAERLRYLKKHLKGG